MRFPFAAVPKSWYHLVWADELRAGETREVEAFGETITVHRAEDGVLSASPDRFPICEKNEMIWAYYDPAGEPPAFALMPLPELEDASFLPLGRVDRVFSSHVQEIVENAVDIAHYAAQHGFVGQATLGDFAPEAHAFRALVIAKKRVFGVTLPIQLAFEYCGMGFGVGRATGPLTLSNVVTCLPIDAHRIRMRFTIFAIVPRVPMLSAIIARLLRWHVWADVKGEIALFENKLYRERPLLSSSDGPIMKVRAWCRQFYPAEAA
ncbi:MAG: hypothetical protein IT381_15660 [Deltaproteobacteria bacterium]|nr:hypothetical protein [Deltaproteobacteria bacterium]